VKNDDEKIRVIKSPSQSGKGSREKGANNQQEKTGIERIFFLSAHH
jgi:hypothetical protein